MSNDDILNKLSSAIVEYLNEETIWSHFSSFEGTTRGMLYSVFFDHYQNIKGEMIRDKVVTDIERDLTEEEVTKLSQVVNAWQEWSFILERGIYLDKIQKI